MDQGELFKCKSNHIVPFVRGLLLLLGQKPEPHHSPPNPVRPGSCPPCTTSLSFPVPLCRPSLSLDQPHSLQPQDLCTLLLSGTFVPPFVPI